MSTPTQHRPLPKSVAGNAKSAKSANDPVRGTVMARALLNAFQFPNRKPSDSGKTKNNDDNELKSGQRSTQQRSIQQRTSQPRAGENIGSKLGGNLDITAVLSKAAGFPINLSCLSAFGDISAPAIAKLLRVASFKKNRAKSIVYREGEIVSSITYILEGSLTAYRYSLGGRELVLDYLGRGDFVGEVPMLLANSNYKAAFKAREECKIAEIAVSDFQRICQRYPECLVRVAGQLAQRLNRSDDRIYDLVFLDVTARVENALNYLANSPAAITHPNGMQVRITRQEIGSLVGCSREMVGRAIKELTLAEKISVDGKNIVVFG